MAGSMICRLCRHCLLLPLALLSACAGDVPSEPFQAFSKSLIQLHQGTDQALANIDEMSEDRFLRDALKGTAAGDVTKLEQLRIKISPTDALSWKTEPLFLKIEQFRDGANQTTGALVSYADLLKALSAPELLSKETFDNLAADLNENANNAITKISGAPPDAGQLALFSTLAAETARRYLENKRRSDLIAVLTENQTTVENFARHMQSGVKIAAKIAANEYDEKFQQISKTMIVGRSPAGEAVRKTALLQLIELDRKYISDLKTFNGLHQAYGQIPGAHRELARKLTDEKLSLTSIIALLETGQRLERNFDQAVAVNKSKAAQAVADQASAQARILEAEADAAQLRATAAEVEAIRAKAQADADPGNAQKRVRADDLRLRASKLQALAKDKKSRAAEAQTVARTAQQQADEIKTRLLSVSQ
jgi:hypothetical protein